MDILLVLSLIFAGASVGCSIMAIYYIIKTLRMLKDI